MKPIQIGWYVCIVVLLLTGVSSWGQDGLPDESSFYSKSWAVVIGINAYQNFPSLEYARNDATAVETRLKSMGFEVIRLLDTEATRDNMLRVLQEELPAKVEQNDRLVIFYAGHGAAGILPSGEEVGFIIPSDGKSEVDGRTLKIIGGEVAVDDYATFAQRANFISVEDIRYISDQVLAKHILYIIDGCYSGFLDPAAYSRLRPPERITVARRSDSSRSLVIGGDGNEPTAAKLPSLQSDPMKYFQIVTARDTVQILTAGSSGEAVYEKSGHGLFTHYLLQALDGAADKNSSSDAVVGDCVVTATELGNYLKEKVPEASNFSQSPLFNRISGEGEFIFIPPICKPIDPVDAAPPRAVDTWTSTDAYKGPKGQPYNTPAQVLVDQENFLYVLDTGLQQILAFDPQGRYLPGHLEAIDIPAPWKPSSMAVGYGGNLWVYYSWKGEKKQGTNPAGKLVLYQNDGRVGPGWHGRREPVSECVETTGTAVPFPVNGLFTLDFEDNLILVDQDTGVLMKCDRNGKLLQQWGKHEDHALIKNISQYKTVTNPQGLAVDIFGYIYVADTKGHGIQKYRYDGEWIPSWPNVKGDKPHFFNSPHGLAVDRNLYVYVADTENHRIKKYTSLNAKLLTYWGKENAKKGSKYGEFNTPPDVADTGNKRIQKFVIGRK